MPENLPVVAKIKVADRKLPENLPVVAKTKTARRKESVWRRLKQGGVRLVQFREDVFHGNLTD